VPVQAKDFIRKWSPGGPAAELNERAGAQADDEILRRLLALNLERAAKQGARWGGRAPIIDTCASRLPRL
jgi:hypothetical protein